MSEKKIGGGPPKRKIRGFVRRARAGRFSLAHWPIGLRRELKKSGYKIARAYINLPTIDQTFAAIFAARQYRPQLAWKIVRL